jgi:hypothetical protein
MPHALCDWEDTYMKIPAWRCVNCGEVIDAVILQHREQPFTVAEGRSFITLRCKREVV